MLKTKQSELNEYNSKLKIKSNTLQLDNDNLEKLRQETTANLNKSIIEKQNLRIQIDSKKQRLEEVEKSLNSTVTS